MKMKIAVETAAVLVLAVLDLLQQSLACSCLESHPQTSYCNADFVIKAKVKSEKQLYGSRGVKANDVNGRNMFPSYKRYRIRLSRIFKESATYQNMTKQYVYTSSMDSTCGVQLHNGTKYLLQGKVRGGKPMVSICDTVMDWHHVSVRQRKGYNYLYEKYCACKIELCDHPKCEKKRSPGVCLWNAPQDSGKCYPQHSMCVDHGDQGCKWSRTTLLKQCLNTVKQRLEP